MGSSTDSFDSFIIGNCHAFADGSQNLVVFESGEAGFWRTVSEKALLSSRFKEREKRSFKSIYCLSKWCIASLRQVLHPPNIPFLEAFFLAICVRITTSSCRKNLPEMTIHFAGRSPTVGWYRWHPDMVDDWCCSEPRSRYRSYTAQRWDLWKVA